MHRYGFENFGVTVLEYDDQVTRPAQRSWYNTVRVREVEKQWVHRLDAVLGLRFGCTEGEARKFMHTVPRRATAAAVTYRRRRHGRRHIPERGCCSSHGRTVLLLLEQARPPERWFACAATSTTRRTTRSDCRREFWSM